MCVETAPGQQAPLDWKESIKFTLKSSEIIDINTFVLILAASRFQVYRLSLTKFQDVLFSFIDNAFEDFGAVPRELLTNNMKMVMDEPRTGYSKGKVEAPTKLLDEIFAYNGLIDYQELNGLEFVKKSL